MDETLNVLATLSCHFMFITVLDIQSALVSTPIRSIPPFNPRAAEAYLGV